MIKENIELEGIDGTWYVIDESIHKGENVYLLENEIWGDETPGIIVNEKLEVLELNSFNGFDDLED